MNTRFTVEELNLISIYIYEDRESLIEEMSDALPYMDEDMRDLANCTLEKLRTMQRHADMADRAGCLGLPQCLQRAAGLLHLL